VCITVSKMELTKKTKNPQFTNRYRTKIVFFILESKVQLQKISKHVIL